MAGDFDDRNDDDYKPRKRKAKKKSKSNGNRMILIGVGGGLLGLFLVCGIVGFFALRGKVYVPGIMHPSFATVVTPDLFNRLPQPPLPLAEYTAVLGEGRLSQETDMSMFGIPGQKIRSYHWGTNSALLTLEVTVDPDGSEWVGTVAATFQAAGSTTRMAKSGLRGFGGR